MRYLLLAALCSSLSFGLSAKLAPRTVSPTYTHLAEVNARWLHEAGPAGLLGDTSYADESARIRHHLLSVHATLSARDVGGLSPKHATARERSLTHLLAYAERGRFPLNTAHPERKPYFVDGDGTHCAVGYLLHRAGEDALVARIRARTNNGYVLGDLAAYPEIAVWAAANGFTAEELAWIQPGYSGSYILNARAFGNGLGVGGGQVSATAVIGDAIYVGGDFTSLDGVDAAGFARIEGDAVTPLTALTEHVTGLEAVPDTDLLLYTFSPPGGTATTVGVYDVAADSTSATFAFATSERVFLHVDGTSDPLIFVGSMRGAGGEIEVYRLALEDYALTRVAEDYRFEGVLHDSYGFRGVATLGGEFVVYDAGGQAIDSNFVRYDPTADAVLADHNRLAERAAWNYAMPTNLPVFRFAVVDTGESAFFGEVYAHGEHLVYDEARDTLYLQAWSQTYSAGGAPADAELSEERSVYGAAYASPGGLDVSAFTLASRDLVLSGAISPRRRVSDDADATQLVVQALDAWVLAGTFYTQPIPIDGRLTALAELPDGSLFLAGSFDSLAGAPVRHLAYARPEVSDAADVAAPEFELHYAAGELHVDLGEALGAAAELYLYGADGRLLSSATLPAGQPTHQLPVELPAGPLFYAVDTERGTAAGAVIALDN